MAIPPDLRLDHTSGHHREHPSPLVDQITRTALVVDAASCHCLDYCFLPVAQLLEICPKPLFQRELVGPATTGWLPLASAMGGKPWVGNGFA